MYVLLLTIFSLICSSIAYYLQATSSSNLQNMNPIKNYNINENIKISFRDTT